MPLVYWLFVFHLLQRYIHFDVLSFVGFELLWELVLQIDHCLFWYALEEVTSNRYHVYPERYIKKK